jgi:hypothetical protein
MLHLTSVDMYGLSDTFCNFPDLLFRLILLAGCPLDVLDQLLAMALRFLSDRPILGGYDEQQTLS